MASFPRRSAGVGGEAVGDPFGAGGFLHVVRALAVEGQTVRVVFDEEPVHKSGAGNNDALNPSNYIFSIAAGQAAAPEPVGVKREIRMPGELGVFAADERGFDVQVDRPFVVGITYRVEARNILAQLGGALGFPFASDFAGVVPVRVVNPPTRRLDLTDFKSDPFVGGYVVDEGGDVAAHGGLEGLRKRIFRRLTTPRGAFSFLPDYGLGLRLKRPFSVRELIALKTDATEQIKQEPEVLGVQVSPRLDARGILFLDLRVKTREAFIEMRTRHSGDGTAVIL